MRAGMLFTEDAFGLLFVGRLSSILCGLVYAGYVRAIAKKLFAAAPDPVAVYPAGGLPASGGVLFTYLNCDSMALMATAMILWYLLRGMEDGFSVPSCLKLAASFSICIPFLL